MAAAGQKVDIIACLESVYRGGIDREGAGAGRQIGGGSKYLQCGPGRFTAFSGNWSCQQCAAATAISGKLLWGSGIHIYEDESNKKK